METLPLVLLRLQAGKYSMREDMNSKKKLIIVSCTNNTVDVEQLIQTRTAKKH
jgi:hypothetical protein